MPTTWTLGYHRRNTMSNLYSILAEMHPGGDFNESELWEAIAEAEGVDVYDIMDGDLTEYL
jgi:hypothetical protein